MWVAIGCLRHKDSHSIGPRRKADSLEFLREVNFQMRRTGHLGLSLLLILVVVSALPGYGQAAQAKQPQAKTQPEYNAYLALFNEKDPGKKAELAEKFI